MEECLPIKTLDDVLNFKSSNCSHVTVPLTNKPECSGRPKTLVCHDMKGGYLEDRFIQGVHNKNCYSFVHWSIVDVFVYFSHSLVSIPPCSWINAAHRNGTIILGTFITEWDAGFEVCKNFLSSTEMLYTLCHKLVTIALAHGFDGWLINIENKIKPEHTHALLMFLETLTKKMHQANPDSMIIWYDSVLTNGDLKWQNALNENNRSYFAACDGIFLNYNWKAEHLRKSQGEAGFRHTNVYVGVDVFGRGCLGGGGFCTNVAVEKARNFGFSVAIFAPGWVYECLDENNFLNNQYRFWDLLINSCFVHTIKSLPFSSSFCPGFGEKLFRNGEVISSAPWYDMSLQEPQPSCYHGSSVVRICLDDAISGGGSLQLNIGQVSSIIPQSVKIFQTNFVLEGTCLIKYAFKWKTSLNAKFALVLDARFLEKAYPLLLLDETDSADDFLVPPGCNPVTLKPALPSLIDSIERDVSEDFKGSWITRTYILPFSKFGHHNIRCIEARVVCDSPDLVAATALLGYFEIGLVKWKVNFHGLDSEKHVNDSDVQVKSHLCWNKPSNVRFCDVYYQVEGKDKQYLETTSQEFLNVELTLNKGEEHCLQFLLFLNGLEQAKHAFCPKFQ